MRLRGWAARRCGRGAGSSWWRASFLVVALLATGPRSAASSAAVALFGGLQARVSVGHDTNLLDASDTEQSSFANHDPRSFFVVNSMRDQFVEGELQDEWRLPHFLAGRPRLRLGYERRQYLRNPIKSSDRYAVDARLNLAARTRADLGMDFQPQIYRRHRRNVLARPGEPVFRPEVYRRTDLSAALTQGLAAGTSIRASIEGSIRDYRAPFDGRDRHLLGGGAALLQSLPWGLRASLSGSYSRTWSRNDPALLTDLSNREWAVTPRLEARSERTGSGLSVEYEFGRRRYTSDNPADRTYFGRTDRLAQIDVELTQTLKGSLAVTTRFTHGSSVASIPVADSDDDTFSDTEVQTGLLWDRSNAKGGRP